MIGTLLIIIISILLYIWYKKLSKINEYWADRKLPYAEPLPLFGNMIQNVLKIKTFGEVFKEISFKYKNEKIVGAYNFTRPVLLINDPEYAEIVLIKEFSRFMNRTPPMDLKDKRPLDKNLFGLSGWQWKAVRNKMTPVFTTNKLKGMLPQIDKLFTNTTVQYIDKNLKNDIQMQDVVETFTMNVRASCVFGMDTSNLNRTSEFMTKVRDLAKFNLFNYISQIIALWFPRVAAKLNLSVFGQLNEKYFVDLLLKTINERSRTSIVKSDFVQMLLELKQTGSVRINQLHSDDDYLKMDLPETTTENLEIDDDILISQGFAFLLAGLDTLKSTITMALLSIASDKRIKTKLQEEVDRVVKKHGNVTYTALADMEYLNMCVQETMRMYPPGEILARFCLKEYTFSNGVTVHPGTSLFIPIARFLVDDEYFPDPMKFNPERFETSPRPCTFIPFGAGPRMCISMRFAMMEMKMFLCQMMYNYDIKLSSNTELPVKTDKWFFLRRVTSPVFMKFSKRGH